MTAQKKTQSKSTEASSASVRDKEFEEMKAQLAAMQKMLNENTESSKVDDESFDIRPDKNIDVMSLLPWTLVLKSDRSKKGYIFEKQFQRKRIPFGDLRDILDDNWSFAEAGYFQVLNRDVVRMYGLEESYQNALDKFGFERMFGGDTKKAISLAETINDKQLNVIANMLIAKLKDGEDVDMNLVYAVASRSGIDIVEKAEIAKALMAKV